MRPKSIQFQLLAIMLLCYLAPTLLLGGYMGNVFFSDLRDKTERRSPPARSMRSRSPSRTWSAPSSLPRTPPMTAS